jgi:BASS family bile acid:Na+ symporter
MDTAHLIRLAITASVLLLVFALGLEATFADTTTLVREASRPPYRLARALLAMYGVVPAVAAAVAALFVLTPAVEIALLAMAVSPVPPILPRKQLKAGGMSSYVYGLLVAVSLLAVILVPLAVATMGLLFGRDVQISTRDVARLIAVTVLAPLLAGLVVRRLAPDPAERLAPAVSGLGTGLLVAGLLPVLVTAWPAIVSLVGNGTIAAIAAVVGAALAAGHRLGGPLAEDRTALGIAACMRHPGVALAIARLNFPDATLVPAAILLYVLVGVIVTSLYVKVRGRAEA